MRDMHDAKFLKIITKPLIVSSMIFVMTSFYRNTVIDYFITRVGRQIVYDYDNQPLP